MLKLMGAVLILSASIGLAWCVQMDLKNRLTLLYEVRKLLNDILYEQKNSLQPVERILLYSVETKDKRLSDICHNIGQKLLEKETGSGIELWRREFREKRRELSLGAEAAEIIENAGSAYFGKSMEENQKTLSLYIERLNFIIETERKERREKQKVYQTISVMCGLILIILLL